MKTILSITTAAILGFGAYAFAAKKAPVPVNDTDTVNSACPISGKGIKKVVTVAFCCSKCKGKYTVK